MHMPSGTQWLIILLIVVLLFGAKKIPELARGLGRGIKTFKDEMNSEDESSKNTQKIEENTGSANASTQQSVSSDESKKV